MDYFDGYLLDGAYDKYRHCYARARVLRATQEREPVIDAVMTALKAPISPTVRRRLPLVEKTEALVQHIDHLRKLKTSPWYRADPPEIFAAGLFISKCSASEKSEVFFPVKKEDDLAAPVRRWLEAKKLTVHAEVSTGQSRVDLLGHRPAHWWNGPEVVIAVELKNSLSQMKRGLDQMTNYSDYAQEVYLACTPHLAASYLKSHANSREVWHWDGKALERKLKKFGFGLLLVENDRVFEVRASKQFSPGEDHLRQLRSVLG